MSSKKRTETIVFFMAHRNSNIAVYKIQIACHKAKSRSKSNKGGALAVYNRLRLMHNKIVNIFFIALLRIRKVQVSLKISTFVSRSS